MAQPVKTFRYRGISASIFENETHQNGQPHRFYKVNLQRAFKQGEEYKHNSSFSREDIPIAIHVLQLAWQFVLEAEHSQTAQE
jgi:hypothetical protein